MHLWPFNEADFFSELFPRCVATGSSFDLRACFFCSDMHYQLLDLLTMTWLQRSSVPLSHPSWTFSLHDAPAKPTASWRTPPTQSLPAPTIRRCYRGIRGRSARLLNSFFPQAVRALNPNHPALLWNPMQTPISWNTDPPPPLLSKHPPTLPHQRKNCELFLCNSSVLHTGEWACTNHL